MYTVGMANVAGGRRGRGRQGGSHGTSEEHPPAALVQAADVSSRARIILG